MSGLPGRVLVKSLAAGTITPPAGATLYSLTMHASAGAATVTIGSMDAIAVINGANPTTINFPENEFAADSGLGAIVCVNTDSVTAVFKIIGAQ